MAAMPAVAVRAPRGREDGCTRAAAARRAEFARERTGVSLEPVSSYSFDQEGAAGNVEHFIGVAQEPIGLAGPLLVNGEHARGGFCVAMATAEGTLMAGHNRRGGLLDEAGGVTTMMHDHMQRAPSFLFPSARAARAFGQWLPERFEEDITAAAETTTGSGRLAETGQYPPSRMLSTRFHYTTADAAGQKLTGKATQAASRGSSSPASPASEGWCEPPSTAGWARPHESGGACPRVLRRTKLCATLTLCRPCFARRPPACPISPSSAGAGGP